MSSSDCSEDFRPAQKSRFVVLPFLILLLANTCPASTETISASANLVLSEKLANVYGVKNFRVEEPAVKETDSSLECSVTLGDKTETLLLSRANTRSPIFQVRIQRADGSIETIKPPTSTIWTGKLAGNPGSVVNASWRDGKLTAHIDIDLDDELSWQIKPVSSLINIADSKECVVYLAKTSIHEGACALTTESTPHTDHNFLETSKDINFDVRVCEIACDTDYEFYLAHDESVEDVTTDIEMVIAGVSSIYERDLRLTFQITDILIRTTEPDPYGTTVPFALLDAFSEEWRNNQDHIQRDVVHLFTGKDLDGTAIGIAWDAEGVCNTYYGYSLVQSMFDDELAKRFAISAHELGHNFDGNHCDYGDWWCRIMCASIGDCSAGYNSFGTQTTERLLTEIDDMDCFEVATATHIEAGLPFFDDFSSSGIPDPARWTAIDEAKNISGRLELEAGDTYGVNELGTVRTLPMQLVSTATITLKARSHGLPANQPLKIQCFDSTNWQWLDLGTIYATGGSSNAFVEYSYVTPPAAAGSYFSVRISADGIYGDYNDEWHIDDFSIEPNTTPVWEIPTTRGLTVTAAPNPFNPTTSISFRLEQTSQVRVTVCDLAGQIVSVLVDEVWPAGNKELLWHGRDATGKKVASGVYVVKFTAGQLNDSLKIVMLK